MKMRREQQQREKCKFFICKYVWSGVLVFACSAYDCKQKEKIKFSRLNYVYVCLCVRVLHNNYGSKLKAWLIFTE